jgi:predicted nucleotidyltransferase
MNNKLSSKDIFEILRRNRSLLKKYRVRKIGLFGSYGRDEALRESDIDLLVDFENKSIDNFIELAFALEELFGRRVDLLTEKGISPYILPYIRNEVQWYEA